MAPQSLKISPPSANLNFLIVAMAILSLWWISSNVQADIYNANVSSRMAMIESLSRNGTFRIDETRYGALSIDKSWIEGHFYSTKPFMLSIIGAGVYEVYRRVTGTDLIFNLNKPVIAVVFALCVIPHVFFLFYFYKFLLIWVQNDVARAFTFASVSLAWMGLGYATVLNNHYPSSVLLLISYYHAFKIIKGKSSGKSDWVLCGFTSGLLPTFDHPGFIFSLAVFFALFFFNPTQCLRYFLVPSLVPIVVHFQTNFVATGSLLPIEVKREYFKYPGSFWINPGGYDAKNDPKDVYAFNMLFGHHGFLSMTPVLLLGFYDLFQALKDKARRLDASIFFIPIFLTIVFYIFFTKNYGGSCMGVRWFLPFMPLVILSSGRWLESNASSFKYGLFILFMAIGFWTTRNAMTGPWKDSAWDGMYNRWLNEWKR